MPPCTARGPRTAGPPTARYTSITPRQAEGSVAPRMPPCSPHFATSATFRPSPPSRSRTTQACACISLVASPTSGLTATSGSNSMPGATLPGTSSLWPILRPFPTSRGLGAQLGARARAKCPAAGVPLRPGSREPFGKGDPRPVAVDGGHGRHRWPSLGVLIELGVEHDVLHIHVTELLHGVGHSAEQAGTSPTAHRSRDSCRDAY